MYTLTYTDLLGHTHDLPMQRPVVRRGVTVVLLHDQYVGLRATVRRILTQPIPGDPALRRTLVQVEPLHTGGKLLIPADKVAPVDALTLEQQAALQAEYEARQRQQAQEQAEYESDRQQQERADYALKRSAYTGRLEVLAQPGDYRAVQMDPFYGHGGASSRFSSTITVYQRREVGYAALPNVTVSWSALGNVTPEQAEQFARALLQAAERAKDIRRAMECEDPALLEALEDAGVPVLYPINP